MNGTTRRQLLWLLVALAVVAAVGVAAYELGVTAGRNGSGPFFGRFGGGMMGYGLYGWFGFLGPLLLVLLFVGLLGWAFTPSGYGRGGSPRGRAAPPSGVDQLKELTQLHSEGALTDEEFTAAKRRLLRL